jgi:heme exporter protein B
VSYLHVVWAIVRRDITAEAHTREALGAMAVFAVLTLFSFSLALDLQGALARTVAPGVYWTIVVFAGMLGLSLSFSREVGGGLDGLRLAPVDPSALFLGKALGNLVFLLVLEALLLPLAIAFLGLGPLRWELLVVVLLGTTGYAAAGTLLAAMAASTRAQSVALPILLLPLVAPLLLGVVQAMAGLFDGAVLADVGGWLRLVAAYDLLMVAGGMVLFGVIIED